MSSTLYIHTLTIYTCKSRYIIRTTRGEKIKKNTFIKKGEPAPFEGVLITKEEYERKQTDEEILDKIEKILF